MVEANLQPMAIAEIAAAPPADPQDDADIHVEIAQLQLHDEEVGDMLLGLGPQRRRRVNKPRGGPTGFAIFVKQYHDAIRADIVSRQLPRRRGLFLWFASRMWRRLTDDQKLHFNSKANQLRAEFNHRRTEVNQIFPIGVARGIQQPAVEPNPAVQIELAQLF